MDNVWEKLCSIEHLRLAWKRVEEKRGGVGVDLVSITEFARDLERHLSLLRQEIMDQTYQPLPSRHTVINTDGKELPVGIFSVRDRVVQQALYLVLQSIFEPEMADSCHGYHPGRSTGTAVEQVESYLSEGKQITQGDRFYVLIRDKKQHFK